MRLEIKLFAGLKCSNPELPCFGESEFQLEVPDGITIGELRGILGIAPDIPLLTIVNNHHEQAEWILKDDDRVGIFPPIGGG